MEALEKLEFARTYTSVACDFGADFVITKDIIGLQRYRDEGIIIEDENGN